MAAAPHLLVFTLGPVREARRRRLLPPEEEGWERRLHRRCLERVLEAGRSWRMSRTVCSPKPTHADVAEPDVTHILQASGGCFGSRLESAMRRAWSPGSGALVVVGTDTPELGARQVGGALARLRARPDAVVVGPSPDGGIYLLATRRSLAGLLREVAWCSSRARASLEEVLREAGIPVLHLDFLSDLDDPDDLQSWLSRRTRSRDRPDPLIRTLRRLVLERCRSRGEPRHPAFREPLAKGPPSRAPPSADAG